MSNPLNLSCAHSSLINNALVAVPATKIVNVSYYTLGNEPSIGVTVCYNTKEECASGILANGKHFKAMLHGNGSLVYLTGWKVSKPMRQCKVKSVEAAVAKLVKYAQEA